MGEGLKRASAAAKAARSRRSSGAPLRSVRLTAEECWLILYAINIASEDGSIFGAAQPGDGEYERIDNDLNFIARKLKLARSHLGAAPTKLEAAMGNGPVDA